MKYVLRAFGIIFLFAGLITGVGSYVLFQTPLPLSLFFKFAGPEGQVITGLTGNIRTGYHIDKWLVDNEELYFEMENVNVFYSNIFEIFQKQEFTIQEISSSKSTFNFRKFAKNDGASKKEAGAEKKPGAEKKSYSEDSRRELPFVFKINKITYLNTSIKFPQMEKPFVLSKFILEGFETQNSNLNLERLIVDGEIFSLSVQSLMKTKDNIVLQKPLIAVLKQGYSPLLKKDLSVELKGAYQDKKPNFNISSFDGKLLGRINSDMSVRLSTTKLNPAEYFVTEHPIHDISVDTQIQNPMMILLGMAPQINGSFFIGPNEFKIQPKDKATGNPFAKMADVKEQAFLVANLLTTRDVFSFYYNPDFAKKLDGIIGADSFVLKLGNVSEPKEVLSKLYFKKTYTKTNIQEKALIERDAKYFSGFKASGVPIASSIATTGGEVQSVAFAIPKSVEPAKPVAEVKPVVSSVKPVAKVIQKALPLVRAVQTAKSVLPPQALDSSKYKRSVIPRAGRTPAAVK